MARRSRKEKERQSKEASVPKVETLSDKKLKAIDKIVNADISRDEWVEAAMTRSVRDIISGRWSDLSNDGINRLIKRVRGE